MNVFLHLLLSAIFLAAAVECSPYFISDDRVQNKDVAPVLGRGYSIGTNSMQSICLKVEDTTVPSYDYDYSFTDYTMSKEDRSSLKGDASASFGSSWIGNVIASASHSSSSKSKSKKHFVSSTMRIERYYTSIKEDKADLTDDAKTLLTNEDYVGFFKACGPNYIRTIRRAQEVSALFEFESENEETASSFASSISTGGGWLSSVEAQSSFSSENEHKTESKSLKITIKGWGMGLSEDGSETLVATSLEEYHKVMKFAFKSMTTGENAESIGMVYGMEVVPWVDNTAFQVAARLDDQDVTLPLPKSVIPKSYEENGIQICKDPNNLYDQFGYCCMRDEMIPIPVPEGAQTVQEKALDVSKCKPERAIDPTMKKNNLAMNGEFVALLDSTFRDKLNTLFLLEKCITAYRSLPSRFSYRLVKSMPLVHQEQSMHLTYSVKEVQSILDPNNDFGMVKHLSKELDEFVEMYYTPCMKAMYGLNLGVAADTSPKYFMAEGWYNHDQCLKLSCLVNGMRWDRDSPDGGCTPSIIHKGTGVKTYGAGTNCKKDDDDLCKHKETDMKKFITDASECNTMVDTSPSYIMDHYCLPQLTDKELDAAQITELKTKLGSCNAFTPPSSTI